MSAKRKKPTKRRVSGNVQRAHRGRVTVAVDGHEGPPADRTQPEPSSRYTPRRPTIRFRPTWHKVLGWGLVALGVTVGLANDYEYFGSSPLPGGHNEGYLLLAVAIAGFGTWWLGLFDRPT